MSDSCYSRTDLESGTITGGRSVAEMLTLPDSARKEEHMSIRLMAIVALTTLMNSFVGCSSYVDISFDEVNNQPVQSIDRIVFASVIEGVVLKSGDEILFNEQCGLYDDKARVIGGVTEAGGETEIRLDRIEYVLLKRGSIRGTQMEKVNVRNFLIRAARRPWRTHYGRSVQPGKSVKLRRSGGSFDPEKKFFTGETWQGEPIAVKPDDVYLQTRKFSFGRTAMLTIGIATAVAVLYLIELRKDLQDWDITFGN